MCGEGQKLLTLTLPAMTRLLHLGTSASASVIQASTSRTVNAARPHTLQLARVNKGVSLRAVGTTSRGVRASAASNATDYANILVTEVMVTNPLSIRPDATVEECIEGDCHPPFSCPALRMDTHAPPLIRHPPACRWLERAGVRW